MTSFTTHLKREHELILRLTRALKIIAARPEPPPVPALRSILALLSGFLHERHHVEEEEILFPALANAPCLKAGGPRCTFFMEQHLNEPLLIAFRRSAGATDLAPGHPEFHGTPLMIPVEEHRAGREILSRVRSAIERDGSMPAPTSLGPLADYARLLETHAEKENTCLFELADRALSPERQRHLLDLSRDLERREGWESLAEVASRITELESRFGLAGQSGAPV